MEIPWERLEHQLYLQLYGIFVPGMEAYRDARGIKMFREFRLQLAREDDSTDPVSMKLTARPAADTPYSFQNEKVYFRDRELSFPNTRLYRVPIPPEEDLWHLKGYTLPFRGSRNPYRELRLNLKISGHCPGKCLFCHRTHSHRMRMERKYTPDPGNLIAQIRSAEGEGIFSEISRVAVISELFGSEERFLEAFQKAIEALNQAGFPAGREIHGCATDVRSLEGLKRLSGLIRPSHYSFSLECFQNRERWMGPYKAITLEQVYTILENARKAGFEQVQVNYIAGVDTLDACEQGFAMLRRSGLVDSVGLSTLVIFAEDEAQMRLKEANQAEYYRELVAILKALDIKAYHPDSFDMSCPYAYLMEKI